MKYYEDIISTLNSIKGSGSFWSSGTRNFVLPGLNLKNFGELAFPINPAQLETLIGHAKKAPFGKGEATILDANVRSTWEIDASQISFKNPQWDELIREVVKQIKPVLGIEDYTISANLYKMLIYEPGDFFLTHRDSEKEAGMFGTLIIGLPSKHTGGEFVVSFDGKEQQLSFASAIDQYKIPYIAFYADCEHQVKPVLSGYRVCLTYNLVQKAAAIRPKAIALQSKVDELAALFQVAEEEFSFPKAILLGHQYTPANFDLDSLKLNDRSKTEVIFRAAEKLGFYAKLGLVTSYLVGELLTDDDYYSYRSRWDDDDDYDEVSDAGGTMGEVYDEYIEIKHWASDPLPPLEPLHIEEHDIIKDFELNEGDPDEEEAEGYTGNAGMELSYWYHYGAVFVWSKKNHAETLNSLSPRANLQWLHYYTANWKTISAHEKELAGMIYNRAHEFVPMGSSDANYNALADYLRLKPTSELFTDKASWILIKYFHSISIDNWIAMTQDAGMARFTQLFARLATEKNLTKTAHLLHIFESLAAQSTTDIQPSLKAQISLLPAYLKGLQLGSINEKLHSLHIISRSVRLSEWMSANETWIRQMCEAITENPNRQLVNTLLAEQLLQPEFADFPLSRPLLKFCRQYLQQQVDNKPLPPENWTRPLPNPTSTYERKSWSLLSDFMQSPTEQVFLYKRAQAERSDMEHYIHRSEADLSMETIRKGSPHTLKITKTQATYHRQYKHWQEDEKLLHKVKAHLS